MESRTLIKSKTLQLKDYYEVEGPTISLTKDSEAYHFSGSPTGDHSISIHSSEERVEAHWNGYKVEAENAWLDTVVPDAIRESKKRYQEEVEEMESVDESENFFDDRPTLDMPEFVYRQATKAAAAVHSRYIQDGWDEEDIYVTDQNGDTRYSEEAQEIFNDYYDRAEEVLLLSYKKGA